MSNILVTGGAKGLGFALVKSFLENGDNVLFTSHSTSANTDELDMIGSNYMEVKVDLSKEADIDKLVDIAYDEFGSIDVLINNASIELSNDFEDKTKEDFMKTYEVNAVAPFLLSRKIAKRMYDNKKGVIINISSNNSLDKYDPATVDYDASKSALNIISKALAKEYAPYVRVNTIAPGWILTDRVKELNDSLNNKLVEEESKNILLERFANEEDIANLVLFLSSDKASYINDEIIRIDGGSRW